MAALRQKFSLSLKGATLAHLIAHFYAPTRSAGFIEPGQAVKLRYAAYPYQKFGQHQGTVTSVDKTPYAPQELPPQVVAALQSGSQATPEATYRITVQLEQQTIDAYGKPQALKPGMLVEADIIQRSQRIVEWMLDPLMGFAKRTGGRVRQRRASKTKIRHCRAGGNLNESTVQNSSILSEVDAGRLTRSEPRLDQLRNAAFLTMEI
jgi:hypothetical protein